MHNKAANWWYDLQDSLWLVPAVMAGVAVILALAMVRVDQHLVLNQRSDTEWLFGGGAEGARGVLSAIAATMITVTGTVFSITVLALQLASSQLTPRILRNFTGDRGNQVVLGVFIGTFTYALLVLRSVRSEDDDQTAFVPAASVTLAIVFALFSIGFLIFFIHHSARSMQAAVVIDRTAADTRELIDRRFPERAGPLVPAPTVTVPSLPPLVIRAERGGYLQSIDVETLLGVADASRLTIRIDVQVGDFLLPGTPLLSLWPATALDIGGVDVQEIERDARAIMLVGPERTLAEDVEFGFRQLADIALKALSPGINDPTTAAMCIDRLGEALVVFGQREKPLEVQIGKEGDGCLLIRGASFDAVVRVGFGQIRHYGAGDASVAEHLVRTLGNVAVLVPDELRAALVQEARLMVAAAQAALPVDEDRKRVSAAAAWTGTSYQHRDRP